MIQEEELRRLIVDAAETIPPPGHAPEALLASLTAPAVVTPRRRPRGLKVAALAASLVAVAALGATLATDSSPSGTTSTADRGRAGTGREGALLLETDEGAYRSSADPDAVATGSKTSDDASNPATPERPATPTDSAKIIRTGSLDLEVREGAFDGAVERIKAQTAGLGGYVADSTTSESGDSPSGSIVVRVPGDSFETLLTDVRKLGDVKAVSSKGTDVTAQFTDLAARLTALQATRDRLSAVLSEAANVPDILAVQDRITNVQVEIETVQGQQKLLDDQTAFATLAITLGEPGAEAIEIDSTPDEGLGQAWDDARRRFGDAVEGIVSWSGSAAVVVIVGLLLLAASRLAWVGMRRRLV